MRFIAYNRLLSQFTRSKPPERDWSTWSWNISRIEALFRGVQSDRTAVRFAGSLSFSSRSGTSEAESCRPRLTISPFTAIFSPIAALSLTVCHAADFISSWIDVKKKEHTVQRVYDYWILGQASEIVEPRWSVIRNVLGWVE